MRQDGGWKITQHVVRRFKERWRPRATISQVRNEIHALLSTSTLRGKTIFGDDFRVSSHAPEIRFVIKNDIECVTVLPAPAIVCSKLHLHNLMES